MAYPLHSDLATVGKQQRQLSNGAIRPHTSEQLETRSEVIESQFIEFVVSEEFLTQYVEI